MATTAEYGLGELTFPRGWFMIAIAEDVTQETFITIHRKLRSHNPAQSFTSWMMTIARNTAISHHRRRAPAPLDPAMLAAAIKDPEKRGLVVQAFRPE